MKRSFVDYNKRGSDILYASSKSDFLDIFAVRNLDRVFLTVVNKKDIECTAHIEVLEHNYTHLMNKADSDEHNHI